MSRQLNLTKSTTAYLCLALLFGGLLLDLSTRQALVVAIIYNVPIVLSAPVGSRRFTTWTILLALAANAAAAYTNAVSSDGFSDVSTVNRLLAALSLVLVGAMTLLFESRSADVRALESALVAAERERALREMSVSLSRPFTPDELLATAAVELRKLLDADAVVICGIENGRFTPPRFCEPNFTDIASEGKLATWVVDILPVTATPVTTTRSDQGPTSIARLDLAGAPPRYVVAHRPRTTEASIRLKESLGMILALHARAKQHHDELHPTPDHP